MKLRLRHFFEFWLLDIESGTVLWPSLMTDLDRASNVLNGELGIREPAGLPPGIL